MMPTILIAETNGTMAQRLAQTLTGAGHRPLLAPDLRAALKEWRTMPDLLLSLAFAGGELLRQLPALPNAAGVSVPGMTDRTQVVAPNLLLLADVLWKPIRDWDLCRAVDRAQVIRRPLRDPPDPGAVHVCQHLLGQSPPTARPGEGSTWTAIADWTRHLGLLTAGEADLLRRLDSGSTGPGCTGHP
jgi:CheY-like chemotaxis protein